MFPHGETEAQQGKKLAKATQQRSWDSNPGLADSVRLMCLLYPLPLGASPHPCPLYSQMSPNRPEWPTAQPASHGNWAAPPAPHSEHSPRPAWSQVAFFLILI